MGNTLGKISSKTEQALQTYYAEPQMGASWRGRLNPGMQVLRAGQSGYLTHINMASLQKLAEEYDTHIYITVRPGKLLMPDTPVACINRPLETTDRLLGCFVIAGERTYEQDPEWGFIVLSEAAQRALSSVNDPGTAVSVMVLMLKLLTTPQQPNPVQLDYDRLSIVEADKNHWIEQSFMPIARDGANLGSVEVGTVMQKVLGGIHRNAPDPKIAETAKQTAGLALARFRSRLDFDHDAETVARHHRENFGG